MAISFWRAIGSLGSLFSGKDFSYGIIPLYQDKKGYTVFIIQHGKGHWGIPKGHAEYGETPREAAERELKEETGLKAEKIDTTQQFYEKYFFTSRGKHIYKVVTYYLGEIKDKKTELQKSEVQDGRWVSLEEAVQLATHKPTKQLLKSVKAYVEKKK